MDDIIMYFLDYATYTNYYETPVGYDMYVWVSLVWVLHYTTSETLNYMVCALQQSLCTINRCLCYYIMEHFQV